MYSPHVSVNLSLSWGACIWHGNVIGPWTGIANGTVFWGVLRASISIRRAASSSACEVRRQICSSWSCPIAHVLRGSVLRKLNRLLSFINCLFLGLLKPLFETIFLPALASCLISVHASYISLRSFLSQHGSIELLIVIAPPLRIYHGVQWGTSWLQACKCVFLN